LEGTFEDRRRLTRAVRKSAENGVPVDTIRVFIVGENGTHMREWEVEDEAGTQTGTVIGAVVGAGIGPILAIPFSAGMAGKEEPHMLSSSACSPAGCGWQWSWR